VNTPSASPLCRDSHRSDGAHYRALLLQLMSAELKSDLSRAYLGFAWWVIEPVIYMLVFYLVFGLIFERGGPGFVPMLLAGLVSWRWFDTTTRSAMNVVPRNSALMQQVYVPKIIFPLVAVAAGTLRFAVVLSLLIVFLFFYGIEPTASWLALPLVILVELVFVAATACLTGLLVPLLPDLRIVINNALLLLLFLSGVFYMALQVPEHLRSYFFLNPMAVLIDAMRNTLVYGSFPDWQALFWVFAASLCGLAVAWWLFRRYDLVYPKLGL
jgi:lipopolysaccharide transport system permease protein